MVQVTNVAQYLLEKVGRMTTIKLQKLVYYCQAWSLVWTDEALFDSVIEAWANGPVTPYLFSKHKGLFQIGSSNNIGDSSKLLPEAKEVIEAVIATYGDKNSQWLVELTHLEEPWREARCGALVGEICNNEITLSSMHNYYSGLSA